MLECVQLLLVVRVPDYDVAFDLVQLSHKVYFRDDFFQCQVFWRRSLGPLFFSIFVLLFGLLRRRFLLLDFSGYFAILVGLDAPSWWLLLQVDSNMVQYHGDDIFGTEQSALVEVLPLTL